MWRDPMDELIADLERIVPPERPTFNDDTPPLEELQAWADRMFRLADADWDGIDPDEVDPTFEREFAEYRARWPRYYKQDPPGEKS